MHDDRDERINALASRVGVQIEAMEALCERMHDVGLSTQDVAECAGMTIAELTAAMRNERALTLEELGALAYAAGARVVIRIEAPRVRVVPCGT